MPIVVRKCWGLYIVLKKNYHQQTAPFINMIYMLNAQYHTVLIVLIHGIKRKNRPIFSPFAHHMMHTPVVARRQLLKLLIGFYKSGVINRFYY